LHEFQSKKVGEVGDAKKSGRTRPRALYPCCRVQHSNSRFESIRYANLFVLQKNRLFDSPVVVQFLLLVHRMVAAKKISHVTSLFAAFNTFERRQKTVTQCILRKLLLTYYSNISVQAANLSQCRIESNRKNRFGNEDRIETFLPELECSILQGRADHRLSSSLRRQYIAPAHDVT